MFKKKIHPAWIMFLACCFLQIGGMGTLKNTLGIMVPAVIADLHFAQGPFMLYVTIQCIVMSITMPIAGRVIARYNIRVVLTISSIMVAGCYAAMGTFSEIWQWYVAGAIGGCFSFICFLVAPVIISNWFVAKVGIVMAIAMASDNIMGAIINPVSQMLIASIGWRSTYMVLGAIGLACLLPFTLFVFKFKPSDMGLLPYGAHEEAPAGEKPKPGVTFTRTAIEGVSRNTAIKSVSFVCLFIVAAAISLISSFLQLIPTVASLSNMAAIAGMLSSTAIIGALIGSFVFGWLKDMIGARRSSYIGITLGTLSFVLFIVGIMEVNSPMMFVAAALFGVFTALGTVNNPLLIGEAYGMKDYASIFSAITVATTLFGGFGMSIIGASYDALGSYYPALYCMVALCLLCAVCLVVGMASAKKLPRDA